MRNNFVVAALLALLASVASAETFTASLRVDCASVTNDEALCRVGPMAFGLRLSGRDAALKKYDERDGNYLNFPLADGTAPVLEATICPTGGRIGIPLGALDVSRREHDVILNWDGVHFSMLADGSRLDDEMPVTNKWPIAWPNGKLALKVLSPRVKEPQLSVPAQQGAIPPMPDARPIVGSPQYWTPPDHNAWVGDVVVSSFKGRFHVFYLYDRRHHGSGGGTGRHYFAHLSSGDLVHWFEHPHAAPVEHWWETLGTGTPFVKDGKLCLAYGLHTTRIVPFEQTAYVARNKLPAELRVGGVFRFDDAAKLGLVPIGATYAESDDGVRFRKSGLFIANAQNPTIVNLPDGRFGIWDDKGVMSRSAVGSFADWTPDAAVAPLDGDCPAPFEWGDMEYVMSGFYRMGARRKGAPQWEDWVVSGDDIYEGLSVPMVAPWKGDRRILVGWLNHAEGGWGGWLVFRELVRFPDGKLGTKWADEIPPRGEVSAYDVTDVTKPFVLRSKAVGSAEIVEFRVDPSEGRAQNAFWHVGERIHTAAEIVAERPEEDRFRSRNFTGASDKHGNLAFSCQESAVGKIRGLDKPFKVRFAQYYDPKSDATVFDMEIAGTRTLITRRCGRFAAPAVLVE